MSILVFGGLGHVGSWVVHDLLDRGEDVVVFDARASGFDGMRIDHLNKFRGSFQLEAADVLDVHGLFETMRKYDGNIDAVIFGVAVIAGPDFAKQPFRNIEINTGGMLNVIEICRILGVPKFINMSSGAVYGSAPACQNETTPYQSTDLYCATKICNELLALQYGTNYGIDVRNARLKAVYGPGRLPSKMHELYRVLFGPLEGMRNLSVSSGADQAMDWTHVRDTASGLTAILDAEGIAGEAFNISTGVAVTHNEIVAQVEDLVGADTNVKMGPGKFLDREAPMDISKAQRVLGFAPKFADIREGLSDYHEWICRAREN